MQEGNVDFIKYFYSPEEAEKIPLPPSGLLERDDTGPFRVYKNKLNGEKYPSVTTVLSIRDQSELEEFKKKVGDKVFNDISTRAANRGTAVHNIAEKYLSNTIRNFKKDCNPVNLVEFLPLKKIIDGAIDTVYLTETQLHSDYLQVAGTLDALATYNGIRSVIDFKTSNDIKHESEIEHYFVQASVYSLMLWENFKIAVPEIVIILITPTNCVVYNRNVARFRYEDGTSMIDKFIEYRNLFREKFGA